MVFIDDAKAALGKQGNTSPSEAEVRTAFTKIMDSKPDAQSTYKTPVFITAQQSRIDLLMSRVQSSGAAAA
ncbi:hypothetical protein DID80_00280 [Candidatus Marinamargulisbacteria bacterium SCGC AAA071-K20]|nr:hypothetical protein DID80_00280 [Candidatus Marinamargulisbacteria bacterium SCGC AAA071-K20]